MKKLLIASAAAALVAVPALALQQGPARTAAEPLTRTAVQAQVQTRFSAMDANRDGFVTKAEAEARAVAARAERSAKRTERRGDRFAQLDADKDGSISRAEFDAGHARRVEPGKDRTDRRRGPGNKGAGGHGMHSPGMMGGFGARMLERADTDRDGRLSLAEASTAALARFDRADADRDGVVTAAERQAVRQQMRSQRQAQPKG